MSYDLRWNSFRSQSRDFEPSADLGRVIRNRPAFEDAWLGYSIEFGNRSHEDPPVEALQTIADDLQVDIRVVAAVAMDHARSEDLRYEYSVGLG